MPRLFLKNTSIVRPRQGACWLGCQLWEPSVWTVFVQVLIALIVTRDGFPIAYETQYGKANRTPLQSAK